MIDPAGGDFRLAPGSPAVGYGCQTFVRRRGVPGGAQPPTRECAPLDEDVIEVGGLIESDTVWSADLVRVLDDITVAGGVTLTIEPGVRVEFEHYDRLTVQGTLVAVGTPDCRIVFTSDDPENFRIVPSYDGAWNGIRFFDTPDTNAPSQLTWCIFEYSKATGTEAGPHPYGGGALAVSDFAELTIAHCIFRHNVGCYGGAIFCYRHGNPEIAGNLFVDNHALDNGAAIYSAYSHPRVINNTFARNIIENAAFPYIESCAALSFISKPLLANNIFWGNEPAVPYLHSELWGTKSFYTRGNIVAGYPDPNDGNSDADPQFVDPIGVDGVAGTVDDNFRVLGTSPAIDAGLVDELPTWLMLDLDGLARSYDGNRDGTALVDVGVYEAGDCDGDGMHDADEIAGGLVDDCNDNGIPDPCEIDRYGTLTDCNATGIPDSCEWIGDGDFDADGAVTISDLAFFAGALTGPGGTVVADDTRCAELLRAAFDENGDGDFDLADLATLMQQID